MSSAPEREIRRRISERGCITFREFMDVALYWPDGGYYASRAARNTQSDYYTAPSAHPAFGALLAIQAYQMWQIMGCPRPFWIVEVGAGAGQLCHDVVSFSHLLPSPFAEAIRTLCVDVIRERGVEAELPPAIAARTNRVASRDIPVRNITGVILCNELLDAFPVHRVTLCDGEIRELHVTAEGDSLVERAGRPSTPDLELRLQRVGVALSEGWQAEINLELERWMGQVAAALDRGFLVVIDYGRPAGELYSAERPRGTLTTFRGHVQTDDPFHHVGQQDMTAQVDFTALIQAGEENALQTGGCISQGEFLGNLGLDCWLRGIAMKGMPQAEADANRMGMRQLVRPGGMGEFKVLIQSKGVEYESLWGLGGRAGATALASTLPSPRLTSHHMKLMQARYPNQGPSWEELGLQAP